MSFSLSLSLPLYSYLYLFFICLFVGKVISPYHHSDQIYQRSQVPRIASWMCSYVFVLVFFSKTCPFLLNQILHCKANVVYSLVSHWVKDFLASVSSRLAISFSNHFPFYFPHVTTSDTYRLFLLLALCISFGHYDDVKKHGKDIFVKSLCIPVSDCGCSVISVFQMHANHRALLISANQPN